jgi:lipopolysaccharide heptosyltransferase I
MSRPSPRILLVRLSAVGDVVHGLPVLCALREHLPAAHLAWAVHPPAAGLLRGHPALDELIVVPRPWRPFLSALGRLRTRTVPFDVSLDLQGLSKSALVAWAAGARRRIGFAGAEGRELSAWLNNERAQAAGVHVIDRTLTLLRPLGIASPRVRYGLPRFAAAEELAERVVDENGLRDDFAVINPGAGWPSKRWPRPRFAEVARHLHRRWGLGSLVVWAGSEERAWAEEIVASAGPGAQLAPPTTLPQLAAVLRRACLFVSSDTGPLHLAAAEDIPCVALFGPTAAARNGPYGPQHEVVQKTSPGGPPHRGRTAGPDLMERITVEEVCRACDRVLGRRQQAA